MTRLLIPPVALSILTIATATIAKEIEPWAPFEPVLRTSLRADALLAVQEELGLSVGQRAQLQSMLGEHQAAFEVFVKRARPIKEEWDAALRRRTPDGKLPEKRQAEAERSRRLAPLADEQAALDQTLVDAIPSILTEAQLALWPEALHRLDSVRWSGAVIGAGEARIDLRVLCRDLGETLLPEQWSETIWNSEESRSLRRAYATGMHAELLRMVKGALGMSRLQAPVLEIQAATDTVGMVGTGGSDGKRMDEARVQRFDASKRAMVLNREFLVPFAGLLGEHGNQLQFEYWSRALEWRSEQEPRRADALLNQLLEQIELTEEQRAFVEHARRDLHSAIPAVARKILDELNDDSTFTSPFDDGKESRARHHEATLKLHSLVKASVTRALGTLTPEQATRLEEVQAAGAARRESAASRIGKEVLDGP
jgi:hypothetical protein